MKETATYGKFQGRILKLTNLDKILFPETGFTKCDVLNYYRRIAPVLIPHLKGRALTLKRYPSGTEGEYFYEKRCPSHRPRWFKTVLQNGIGFCSIDELAGLMWVANLASLELHVSLAVSPEFKVPTQMVFDLDPGAPADIVNCAEVALWIREALDMEAWVKTSGGKGLQVHVPLQSYGQKSYEWTKSFSRQLAERLEHEHPEAVVSKMSKNLRTEKVLIDWSQNDENKTTVCVYSLRAGRAPVVSTPVEWSEIKRLVRTRDTSRMIFSPDEVIERVREKGDLFLSVLRTAPAQKLRRAS